MNNQLNNIKFRAKSTLTQEWVYGYYYQHEPPLSCIAPPNYIPEKSKHYIVQTGFADWHMPRPISYIEILPDTLGLYTMYKDKNDKEIYTGDIVKTGNIKCEVCYLDGAYVLKILESKCTEYYKYGIIKFSKLEVIGNIHDNKEAAQCQ